VLLLVCLVVYGSNLRAVGAYDTLAASLIPFGLWRGDGLLLDRYQAAFSPEVGYSIVRSKTGHFVSLYPPVTPLLAAPLYFPAAFLSSLEPGRPGVMTVREPMEKLAGSLFAALSVVVLHAVLRRVAPPGLALALAIAYAFGTSTWVISSQSLWQHGPATLLLSIAILLLLDPSPMPLQLTLLGLCAALITANRPMEFLFSAAIAWIVIQRHGPRSWPFFVPAAIVAVAFVSYNLAHFSNLLGGYATYRTPSGETLFNKFPDAGEFLGLLFSNRGLFTFSPFLLFIFLSPAARRHSQAELLRPLLVACLATAILYSSFKGWSGGYCYGPRYLIICLPVLVLALVEPLRRVLASRAGRAAFAVAVALSVAVQAIGAYCFPGGDSGNEAKGAWTIRNSSPVLAAEAGPRPPDFLGIVAPPLTMREALRPSGAQASYEWSSPPPQTWPARTRRHFRVWVWNGGTERLSSFGGQSNAWAVFLNGNWRNAGGHQEAAQPEPGWLSWRLAAGDSIQAAIDLTAPNATGPMRLSVGLEQVGVGPFSSWGSPPLETDVTIVPGPGYDDLRRACEWQAIEDPQEFAAGSTVDIPVHVRNVSRLLWPPEIRMSYRWRKADGTLFGREGVRTNLPVRAANWVGALVPTRVRVDVPPGEYLLAFDLVQDGREPHWFEQDGSPPLLVRVNVR
jgi:hypothetical protein